MFKVCVGHSNDPDTAAAASEIIEQCQAQLEHRPTAGLLLAGIDFNHQQLLNAVCDVWPNLQLIGCTTDGEVSSVLQFQQDSAVLMLFCVDDSIQIGAGIGTQVAADAGAATAQAVTQALAGTASDQVRLCLAVPESLTADSKAILDGLMQALPANIPIVGGLAADRWQFKTTYQFYGREVHRDAVPVLLFSGDLRCAHGVASGWNPIGEPGIVTRSSGRVVYEIDHKPALEYYRSYLGKHKPSSNYPLAVFTEDKKYYLRAPSGEYSEEFGSVSFFADVPQGAKVQMSECTREGVLAATRSSIQQAMEAFGRDAQPSAALYFSCASRRQLLGTRTCEEFELANACVKNGVPSSGFYTNGEISPMALGDTTRFHNETFISLLIGPGRSDTRNTKS